MKILYFSWIKDKIGKSQENIEFENDVKTIEDVIIFLKKIDDNYKVAFENVSSIKVSKRRISSEFL